MTTRPLSPSAITAWLECSWYLTQRQLAPLATTPLEPGSLAELVADKGLAHEAECLAAFEQAGHTVLAVPERLPSETLAEHAARARPLLQRTDIDVLYQFPLVSRGIQGIADFLVRPTRQSSLQSGDLPPTWEPYDAKLARTAAKTGHVLQLCFYAEALEELLGRPVENIHLWLGSGIIQSLPLKDYAPYWRRLRTRLTANLEHLDPTPAPAPCSHCQFCEYEPTCIARWRADDSLVFVADLSSSDTARLGAANVPTLADLAARTEPVEGLDARRLTRLHDQAALQIAARSHPDQPPPVKALDPSLDPVAGHGYDLLPSPDPGDLFFDLEGHPFYSAELGLFFLFGLLARDPGEHLAESWAYDPRWAHDPGEEAATAQALVHFFATRRASHPGYHVYHYNHTERSALAAMVQDTPAAPIFAELCATGLFVDLLTVAKNAFVVGVESYSLKSLEKLPGYRRNAGIERGAGAVLDYDAYMQDHDPAHLDAIARYNEDDVRATLALRDWLVAHRPPDQLWREPVLEPYEGDPERSSLEAALLNAAPGTAEHLLGLSLSYWQREHAATLTPTFEKMRTTAGDLLEDPTVLAGLVFEHLDDVPTARSSHLEAVFSWPEQPLAPEFARASAVLLAGGLDQSGFGQLDGIDLGARRLRLRWNDARQLDGWYPDKLALDDWVRPDPKPAALMELARTLLDDASAANPVTIELLNAAPPRFTGPDPRPFSDDPAAIADWLPRLDHSYVAIQGPPGTGKTYRGARAIYELIVAGYRVGISAMSHAAVDNLLAAVHAYFRLQGDLHLLRAVKKVSAAKKPTEINQPTDASGAQPSPRLEGVIYATTNAAATRSSHNLIAGTTWLFASINLRAAPVDVLVIDEAGQLSLADAVAASLSATNLLLLGDPRQLPQVAKAAHPEPSGTSILAHILKNHATMPPPLGIFLAETRRLHPAICTFISTQFYESRLHSHPSCALQVIDETEAGLRYLPAVHQGRTTECPEEAAIVEAEIRSLLGRLWTDATGASRPLTSEDFLVVAPYNDQVNLLKRRFGADPDLSGVAVGTVDKFQGQEAPVVFFTMTTSSPEDMPRGPDFLFSRHRLNVAVSRARTLAYLVCAPALLDTPARSLDDMRLIATLIAFVEATAQTAPFGIDPGSAEPTP